MPENTIGIGVTVFVCGVARGYGVTLAGDDGTNVLVEMNGHMGGWVDIDGALLWEEEILDTPVIIVPLGDILPISRLDRLPDMDDPCPIHEECVYHER